jgi:hypothetical protein
MISLPLSRGKISQLDEVDIDIIDNNWAALGNGRGKFYAVRSSKTGESSHRKHILLHRVILERKLGRQIDTWDMVDHINGNTLDNRRENLRLADHVANAANSEKITHRGGKRTTSRFKGVRLRNDTKKWEAYITYHQKRINLGCYATELEAARAYDGAAKTFFGDFAKTNILEQEEERAVQEARA